MEIQNLDDRFEIQDKRFQSPFVVKSECCKCRKTVVKDMRYDYIGYPTVNEPFRINFYCECDDGGDNEWAEMVILRVRLEVASPGEDK